MSWLQHSLSDLSQALREGRVTAEQLTQACLDRYEQYEPAVHAYQAWAGDAALEQARAVDALFATRVDLGPLMGIPVSVKDLFGVPGLPTYAGTTSRLPEAWEQSGDIVQALLAQLAIVTGKSHTVEFAFSGIGINNHWDTPVNPWDARNVRIPGGSSSGAGVSLVQGSALLALGTDTAGSVRIPASLTGTVGLKLSASRWLMNGSVPLSTTLDSPGILTRTVEDAIFGFQAIERSMWGQAPAISVPASLGAFKIGVPRNFFWEGVDTVVADAVQAAMQKLGSHGAQLQDMTLPGCDEVYAMFQAGGLAASELSAFLHTHMPEKIDQLDPMIRLRIEGAESISSVDYLRRCALVEKVSADAAELFNDYDVLLAPTIAIEAPTVSSLQEDIDVYRQANMMVLRNTSIGNLMGLSGISIPVGKDSHGVPVGMQLMAGPGKEEVLLAAAALMEKALGTPASILGTSPVCP
ncbi:MAG TPA: amidase family protein [Burkholderiaceae bacterium]|nr:amidase family protein [Burkholderiaceae bacterium]